MIFQLLDVELTCITYVERTTGANRRDNLTEIHLCVVGEEAQSQQHLKRQRMAEC